MSVSEPATATSGRRRGLHHHREFRLFWAGQSVSLVGSAVSFVALPLVALVVLHVDAVAMGVLTAVERLPPLLIGPIAGPLVDRGSRLRLMIMADAVRALLLAWIPIGAVLGVLAFWHLVVIAFGVGALTLLFNVAYPAFLAGVVAPGQLAEGNAKLGASQSGAEVTGSGLAALLIGAGGPSLGVLADAASYLVSVWCLLRLRTREPARPAPAKAAVRHRLAGFWRDVKSGFPLLWRDPVLRAVTVSNAVLAFFAQLQSAVYFIFLLKTLRLHAALIGVLFLIAGGIGFLTAIWSDRLAARIGIGRLVVTGQVILVAGGVLLAVASGPTLMASALIIAGEACFGAGLSLFGVGFTTLFQARATDETRGRVLGTSKFLTSASIPVAAVLGGVLGALFGVRMAMIAGAVGMALGLFAVLHRAVLSARQ